MFADTPLSVYSQLTMDFFSKIWENLADFSLILNGSADRIPHLFLKNSKKNFNQWLSSLWQVFFVFF